MGTTKPTQVNQAFMYIERYSWLATAKLENQLDVLKLGPHVELVINEVP